VGIGAELIAHRAGNEAATLRRFEPVADLIEVDLHAFRRRLEVRHAKVLWPTARRWERWHLVPASQPRPTFGEVLAAASPSTHLLLDLKGFTARVSRRALRQVEPGRPLTASAKGWWLLRPFRRRGVRTVRSAGNRVELWVLRRLPVGRGVDGYGVHQRLLTADIAADLRRRRPVLLAWAVADRDTAERLVGWGVTGLIIDDEALLFDLGGGRPRRTGPVPSGPAVPGQLVGDRQADQRDQGTQHGVEDVVVAGGDDGGGHQDG
jgi:glycerophosphoryl diester phosphodiesterase